MTLSQLADMNIAFERIGSLMESSELHDQPEQLPVDSPIAIRITNGEFTWVVPLPPCQVDSPLNSKILDREIEKLDSISEETNSTLKDINLSVPKGALVMVVGGVGSGKSSLLNAIIGELKRIKGKVEVAGKTGFCAQEGKLENLIFQRLMVGLTNLEIFC